MLHVIYVYLYDVKEKENSKQKCTLKQGIKGAQLMYLCVSIRNSFVK